MRRNKLSYMAYENSDPILGFENLVEFYCKFPHLFQLHEFLIE